VVASAREHKVVNDDDADASGANWRPATKVDKQEATMTP
jgi:hypothetical protein